MSKDPAHWLMYPETKTPRERLMRAAAIHGLPTTKKPTIYYNHALTCSADTRKPIGGSGCGCLRSIRNSVERPWT